MKNYYIFLFLGTIISFSNSSCVDCVEGNGSRLAEDRTRIINSFSEIEATSDFDVYITLDSIKKVTVEGDDNIVPYVRTEVRGNRLMIENKSSKCFKYSNPLEVHVHIPYFNKVVLSGSGNIQCYGWNFAHELLTIQNSGSGNLKFYSISSEKVEARLFGSGNITLEGDCDASTYKLVGSGNIKANNLKSDDAYVNNSGSGNVYVTFLDNLEVDLSGSGNVYFDGDERLVFIHDSGSGEVIHSN